MFSPSSGSLKSAAPLAAGAGAGGSNRPGFSHGRGRSLCNWRWFFRRRFRGRRLWSRRPSFRPYFRARAIFHREDHLADFYFLAFLDPDFLDRASYRRWNFDDGLVGFQLHHRLPFGDARAQRDHQPDQVALVDVFAEFRQLEFCH